MAELTQEQIDDFIRLADTLAKKNPEIARGLRDLSGSLTSNRRALDLNTNNLQQQLTHLKEYTGKMKILSGPGEGGVARFIKGLKDGNQVIDEYKATLRDLDEIIQNTQDSFKKQELEVQREAMSRRIGTLSMKQASADFVKAVGKQAGTTITQTTGTFVRGLQNNASATELSTGILSGAVDLAAGAAKSAGQGMSAVGSTLIGIGKSPYLKAAGLGLSVLGMGLEKSSDGAAKLAKFGLEVLSKEVEKTVNAFNNISRSGAMFADGMTGMRRAANQAGLTTDQFSRVVMENSGLLAASGMGVGEATRRMGAVTQQFDTTVDRSGKSLRRQMLQLGYSFEEQAGLVAETMADLRIGRSQMMGDDRAIAEQTASYAANLRTITALTGEDAKRKMDQARAESTQVAFRLKLQELEQKQPGITQKVMQSMLTMDATSKKALMEQMTIGTVVDKAANVMMSGSEAYGEKITGMADLIESGSFSVEAAQQLQARANDAMQKDLINFREIGVAGMTGALGDLNTAISGQIANMDRVTQEAVTSSQNLVTQQKTSNDALTKGVMEAGEAAQRLKTSMEQLLTVPITQFAKVSASILTLLEKQIADLKLDKPDAAAGQADKKEQSWWQKWGRDIITMGGTAIGTAVGVVGGAGIASVGTGIVGGTIGFQAGEALADYLGLAKNDPGKATGGIARGPTSGYLEKLHGIEAVVPLDQGKSIPVQLASNRIEVDNSELIDTLTQTLSTMLSGVGFSSRYQQSVSAASPAASGTLGLDLSSSIGSMVEDRSSASQKVLEKIQSTYTDIAQGVKNIAGAGAGMLAPMLTGEQTAATTFASRTVAPEVTTVTSDATQKLMQDQLSMLYEIKDILNSSRDLQQQYVYNTYN